MEELSPTDPVGAGGVAACCHSPTVFRGQSGGGGGERRGRQGLPASWRSLRRAGGLWSHRRSPPSPFQPHFHLTQTDRAHPCLSAWANSALPPPNESVSILLYLAAKPSGRVHARAPDSPLSLPYYHPHVLPLPSKPCCPHPSSPHHAHYSCSEGQLSFDLLLRMGPGLLCCRVPPGSFIISGRVFSGCVSVVQMKN